MAFTAADVKKLREMTNVGMMDCKKALTASEGDIDKAIEWLREKGLAASQKKAGRIAAEGMVYADVIDGIGVIVEVNAETDFVSKNDKFVGFVKGIAQVVATEAPADVDALSACKFPGSDDTIEETRQGLILSIGENMKIRRFERIASGASVAYVHGGGRIGVLVNMELEGIDASAVTELGKDICMQIASMNPAFRDKSDVDEATLAREKEIQLAQMANDPKMASKPDKVKEGIVMGKMRKYYEENCLLQQAFVKENSVSVEKHVADVAKSLGGKIAVVKYIRMEKGEGIEKKQEDYAAEVASLAGLKK